MELTAEQLAVCVACELARAQKWMDALNAAMALHAIDTPQRQAAFLAQIGHESGGLKWIRELWGPTPAQVGYENRADLGNTEPGDGRRFMGRGLIQITGRANYAKAGQALGHDFIAAPQDLEQPTWAALSAAWFWTSRGLNELADAGDTEAITRRINGGYNGLKDRLARYAQASQALEA